MLGERFLPPVATPVEEVERDAGVSSEGLLAAATMLATTAMVALSIDP
jgi:hypothetical protein